MTESPAELTRRAHETFNGRDLDGFLALMADDVEIESRLTRIDGQPHRGQEGARRWWSQGLEVFPDYRTEISEVEEHGDGVVLKMRALGRGAYSDTPLDDTIWLAARWQAGRCVWWGTYDSREDALEALQAHRAES